MAARAEISSADEILSFRERYRREMSCQVVHDSIHRRPGWMVTYRLASGGAAAGYGSVAVGGPWQDKPTLLEFYVLPEFRRRAFELFEALVAASSARLIEMQSNDAL
ncbi:MAG TPA: hypothetical protein VFB80_04550, partial [Pirellulaceae bacterium]|nr:hypothetical protein [Pirellulaceae bacterium]